MSEATGPISIQLGRNVSLVTVYQDCSSYYDSSKHGYQRWGGGGGSGCGGGPIFLINLYRKL